MPSSLILVVIAFPLLTRKLLKSPTFLNSAFNPIYFSGAALVAFMTAWATATGHPIQLDLFHISNPQEQLLGLLGLRIDPLSGLISTAVLILGAVVQIYSVRYLQDDRENGKFQKNLALLLSSVLIMLFAQNLIFFFAAWICCSLFLNRLLIHFKDSEEAQRAAKQKFYVSRLGDIFLLGSFSLLFSVFETMDFASIFELIKDENLLANNSMALNSAAFLLILGAMTKSAQIPFHFWLPNTMNTPTPVSAILHAGVINAGGYLVIRMSPFLIEFPHTLAFLALVGSLSAVYGALKASVQTDTKRTLAYSTISQMGFMMVQCGMGAFSIACLHILGHSFYKAYLFLHSGDAIRNQTQVSRESQSFMTTFLSIATASILCYSTIQILSLDLMKKPGVEVLLLILVLAMSQLIIVSKVRLMGVLQATGIFLVYLLLYAGFELILSPTVASPKLHVDTFGWTLFGFTSALFILLFLIHNNISRISQTKLGQKFYYWLYLDQPFKTLFSRSTS